MGSIVARRGQCLNDCDPDLFCDAIPLDCDDDDPGGGGGGGGGGSGECTDDSDCGSGCVCVGDPGVCQCNQPPTCTVSGPTTLTYNAQVYQDAAGARQAVPPTTQTLDLALSDPDGDSVTITNVTSSQDCLQTTTDGAQVHLTPQGALQGITPTLDASGNHCPAEVTVYIKDSHGATNTCRQTLTVTYPPPRLVLIKVLDQNRFLALGPAGWPANPLQDLQFAHGGASFGLRSSRAALLLGAPAPATNAASSRRTLKRARRSMSAYQIVDRTRPLSIFADCGMLDPARTVEPQRSLVPGAARARVLL